MEAAAFMFHPCVKVLREPVFPKVHSTAKQVMAPSHLLRALNPYIALEKALQRIYIILIEVSRG